VINNWNLNNFAGCKLFKNLKYNNNLEELYIYKAGINHNFLKYIIYIIKYSNIHILSLYKSNLSKIEALIKIYSKIQIIKKQNNKTLIPVLFNIDLSNSNLFFLTKEDLEKINEIISKTNNIITDYYDIFKDIENRYVNYKMEKDLSKSIQENIEKKKDLEKKKQEKSNEYEEIVNNIDKLNSRLKQLHEKNDYYNYNIEDLYQKIKEINETMSDNINTIETK